MGRFFYGTTEQCSIAGHSSGFWLDLKNNVGKASYSQLRLILGDGGEVLGELTGIDLTQPDDGRWRC